MSGLLSWPMLKDADQVRDWWNSLTVPQRLAMSEALPEDARLDDWTRAWDQLDFRQKVHLEVHCSLKNGGEQGAAQAKPVSLRQQDRG